MRKKSSKNVVEINGRLYDAQTGLPVVKKPAKDPTKAGVIDGFVKKTQSATASHKSRKPKPAKSVHKQTKKTATLHRAIAKKSEQKQKDTPKTTVQKKRISIPHHRIKRAETTAQSPTIAKFKAQSATAVTTQSTPHLDTPPPAPQSRESEALVASAMEQAEAHVQPAAKKPLNKKMQDALLRKPKLLSMASTAIALLLVGGYITYLNIPNLSLKVAAREAGFEAVMPGYKPSGYKFAGPINYEQGRITLKYDSSNSDDAFKITQRETNWDSKSLLDNYVTDTTDLYQTYQERGLTIYVYDGSEATWVNGGVWYSIEGDSRLNAEQLIRIASSL